MIHNKSFTENILEVEEYELHLLKHIDQCYDTLYLSNRAGIDIDERNLEKIFANIAGIERIKSLVIRWSSKVTNIKFIKSLSGLVKLDLNGLHLLSLDGIEWFKHGQTICIDTGKNRKRNIVKIANTQITNLFLCFSGSDDIDVISRCMTIKALMLSNFPLLPFDKWKHLPVENMELWGGSIKELSNSAFIDSLKSLSIYGCRKLERFVGDNSHITLIFIQVCNRLDMRTINTFKNIEYLVINTIKTEMPFSSFIELNHLKNLTLIHCKVKFDTYNLKSTSTDLEEIWIQGVINKKEAVILSKANPGVLVRNGVWAYKDGISDP
jgi:hypothetical protein